MSGQNYIVPPRSWDEIGAIADRLRIQFSLSNEPEFPVMEFLEMVLDQRLGSVELQIRDQREMGDYEGLTHPDGDFIILREDVYRDAWLGDGRARFTVAHELGHLIMHTRIPMARATPKRKVAPFRLSEAQANQFAAELLMPRTFMRPDDTISSVTRRHRVSQHAAQLRLRFMMGRLTKNGI